MIAEEHECRIFIDIIAFRISNGTNHNLDKDNSEPCMQPHNNCCEYLILVSSLRSLTDRMDIFSGAPLDKAESVWLQRYSTGLSSGAYAGNLST